MARYVGAIDQGTTSSRFIVFDRQGEIVAIDQREHAQITPKPGWVEHDAMEIWGNTQAVVAGALAGKGLRAADLVSVGLTNQRETTLIWNRRTGRRCTMRLCGWTRAPTVLYANSSVAGGRISCAKKPGCRFPPIFPV